MLQNGIDPRVRYLCLFGCQTFLFHHNCHLLFPLPLPELFFILFYFFTLPQFPSFTKPWNPAIVTVPFCCTLNRKAIPRQKTPSNLSDIAPNVQLARLDVPAASGTEPLANPPYSRLGRLYRCSISPPSTLGHFHHPGVIFMRAYSQFEFCVLPLASQLRSGLVVPGEGFLYPRSCRGLCSLQGIRHRG